ncbi:MAG TPA: alpha/beta hydrolase [Candidatus Acidoferrales bacterium]|nr:alpha/beta hydrolase [Candidatus Acidoferrales bacterium]
MTAETLRMKETGSVIYQAKFVDVDGIRTRYYDEGKGEAMVLIHGSRFSPWGSANTWTLNIGGLSRRYRVLAADKLGSGMTDNPKTKDGYTQHAIVQHMYRFMQVMGVDTFHVVGQSNGAYTAARLALEHPDKCKSLVIVDSGTLGPPVGDMASRRRELFANGPEDLKEYIRFHWSKLSVDTSNITDDYVEAAYFMATQPKGLQTLRDLKSDGRESGPESEANSARFKRDKEETHQWIREGRLTMPVLITWGASDPSAILPVGIKLFEMIAEKTRRAQMHIFNNVSHFHYREIPEEWNRVVLNVSFGEWEKIPRL